MGGSRKGIQFAWCETLVTGKNNYIARKDVLTEIVGEANLSSRSFITAAKKMGFLLFPRFYAYSRDINFDAHSLGLHRQDIKGFYRYLDI